MTPLTLLATVTDSHISIAQSARGFRNVRTSPGERAVWDAVEAAGQDGRLDREVERALVAYVPDAVWELMERFADGGPFPKLRFRFGLEADDHAMRGVRVRPESSRGMAA